MQTTPRGTAPAVPETHNLSPVVRGLLVILGTAFLVIGVVGIVLPVLPTTPFLLLTAACYARSSERLYVWLLGQPSLGPIVTEWRRTRSLPAGVKTRAMVVVVVTFVISILILDGELLRLGLAVVGLILLAFLYRIPTTPQGTG